MDKSTIRGHYNNQICFEASAHFALMGCKEEEKDSRKIENRVLTNGLEGTNLATQFEPFELSRNKEDTRQFRKRA